MKASCNHQGNQPNILKTAEQKDGGNLDFQCHLWATELANPRVTYPATSWGEPNPFFREFVNIWSHTQRSSPMISSEFLSLEMLREEAESRDFCPVKGEVCIKTSSTQSFQRAYLDKEKPLKQTICNWFVENIKYCHCQVENCFPGM